MSLIVCLLGIWADCMSGVHTIGPKSVTISYYFTSLQAVLGTSVKDAGRCSPISTIAINTSNTRDALIKETASFPVTCAPGTI